MILIVKRRANAQAAAVKHQGRPVPKTPKPSPVPSASRDSLQDLTMVLRSMAPLSWRTYFLSHMIVKPVQIRVTEPYGISWVEWRILMTVAHAPGLAANEITSAWALDKMTVSRAVRRLLTLKMLKRGKDPNDSRRAPLFVDRKGQEIFDTVWPGAQAHYEDIMSALEPGEFETFCAIADKLILRTTEIARREETDRQARLRGRSTRETE